MKAVLCIFLLTAMSCVYAIPGHFESLGASSDRQEIRFHTPEWQLLDGRVVPNEQPDRITNVNAGEPDLPRFSTLVAIPSGMRAELDVNPTDPVYQNDISLTPTGSANWKRGQSVYPGNSAEVSDVMIMRGQAFVRVTVCPFSYEPGARTLVSANTVDVSLRLIPDSTVPSPHRTGIMTPDFQRLAQNLVCNPETIRSRDVAAPGSYLFIYAGAANVLPTIQPLIDWKHRKGYETHVLNTQDCGNNTTAIRNYIQNAYNTWENPPEFVCIVGDANISFQVPTFSQNFDGDIVYGDHNYALLDGTDILPDLNVGRLSFNTLTELQTIVTKELIYEAQPLQAGDDWLNRVFLLGDPNSSGYATVLTMMYINDLIGTYDSSLDVTTAYSGNFPSQINSALNQGTSFYWYRGFGDYSGWTTDDTEQLTNFFMTPPVCMITCYTGTFANASVSQGEALLRAGTPGNPTGGVGVICSSTATHTCFNDIITSGVAYGLYVDGITTYGAALNRGKLALYDNYPDNPNNFRDWYTLGKNLLGDPGLEVWTRRPQVISAGLVNTGTVGMSSFEVNVGDVDGNPVSGAWVTLLKDADEVFASAWTDESGHATLFFAPIATAGTMQLTVTAHNCVPILANIPVTQPQQALAFSAVTQQANLAANANGSFHLVLSNPGTQNMNNVSATISCADPNITVTQATSSFPDFAAGNTQESAAAYGVQANCYVRDDEPVVFNAHITATPSTGGAFSTDQLFTVPFSAPDAYIDNPNVSTGHPLPNELYTLVMRLGNHGGATFPAGTAHLRSLSPLVEVVDSISVITAIDPGMHLLMSDDAFTLMTSPSVCIGQSLPFELVMDANPAFHAELQFELIAGVPTTADPTGPDAYGYTIYDDTDVNYPEHPVYDWVELNPALGGAGTQIPLNDNNSNGTGDSFTVNLPFNFVFYGIAYSQITVCSNGFIQPGSHLAANWMNRSIPGPQVPRPIIAPFWDDLLIGADSGVFYRYDPERGTMIVEWYNTRSRYGEEIETFQALLYDVLNEPTNLGDSRIKFQYNQIHNIDLGTYNTSYCDHGEFATVGLADETGVLGLEYSFDNLYPVTAPALHENQALLITGPRNAPPYPYLIVSDLDIQDANGDGTVENGESIHLGLSLRNVGLVTATNIMAQLSVDDPMITLLQDACTFPDLATNQSAEGSALFHFSVALACPNNHRIPLRFTVHYGDREREINLSLPVASPELTLNSYSLTDGNDDQLEAGETGTFTVFLRRNSEQVIQNATATLTSSLGDMTVNPPSVSFTQITDEITQAVFNVFTANTDNNGETAVFTLHLSYNEVFQNEYHVNYVIGHPTPFLADDFNDGQNNQIWLQWINTELGDDNLAGGDGQEVLIHPDLNSYAGVISQYVNAQAIGGQDIQKLILRCRYRNMGGNTPIIGIIQEQQTPYVLYEFFENPDINDQSIVMNAEFTPDPPISGEFIFAILALPGESNQTLAIDDLQVFSVTHSPGTIAGTVTLNGGTGDVTQAGVTNGLVTYYPDQSGHYQLPCSEGTYTLTCQLDGYAPCTVEGIQVTHNQTTEVNFTLDYLVPASNLQYELNANQVHLTWDCPESRNMISRSQHRDAHRDRPVQYFLIHQTFNNSFMSTFSTTELEYTRTLPISGTYAYYVTAVYSDGTPSQPSNTVEFSFTGAEEPAPTPPLVFALHQNAPNPFNPETRIAYDLPTPVTNCRMVVYNPRGERVRTLVDESRPAGRHNVTWNGCDDHGKPVAGGIYLLRLDADANRAVRKLLMLK
jgi:hypothetical protein